MITLEQLPNWCSIGGVTLDGKPARIIGRQELDALITDNQNDLFLSWEETIDIVNNHNGEFKFRANQPSKMNQLRY